MWVKGTSLPPLWGRAGEGGLSTDVPHPPTPTLPHKGGREVPFVNSSEKSEYRGLQLSQCDSLAIGAWRGYLSRRSRTISIRLLRMAVGSVVAGLRSA